MSADKTEPTYIRRRAFNKIHVTSWLIYLEKDGFVRCSFQNCNFMAFDVEEMCEHYGFCKGDSSFAEYVCEHCNGRTVSEKKLQLHKLRAHNVKTLPVDEVESASEQTDNGKPSRVLLLSWGFFIDKHNYIKCPTCFYLANTLTEMARHYTVCKQERDMLLYVCPVCHGRTTHVTPLIWHLERGHKIFKSANQFNIISKTMIQYWERELKDVKYASCLHITNKLRDCHYIDVDILGIIEHSQCCKGPKCVTPEDFLFCNFCSKWTSSREKLKHHLALSHSKSHNMPEVKEEQANNSNAADRTVKHEPYTPERISNHENKSAVLKRSIRRVHETQVSNKQETEVALDPLQEVFVSEEYEISTGPEIHTEDKSIKCKEATKMKKIKKEADSFSVQNNNVIPIENSVRSLKNGSFSKELQTDVYFLQEDVTKKESNDVVIVSEVNRDGCENSDTNRELVYHVSLVENKEEKKSHEMVKKNLKNKLDEKRCKDKSLLRDQFEDEPSTKNLGYEDNKEDGDTQIIYLDLVEDKLIAREKESDKTEDLSLKKNATSRGKSDFQEKQKQQIGTIKNTVLEEKDSYSGLSIELVDKEEDSQIIVLDLVEDKLIAREEKSIRTEKQNFEKNEEKTNERLVFKEKPATASHIIFEDKSSKSSKDISETNELDPDEDNRKQTFIKDSSSLKVHDVSEELYQDELEFLEVDSKMSSEPKELVKNECLRAVNDGRGAREQIPTSIKGSCYALFKDDFSSDEDDFAEGKTERDSKFNENIKPSFNLQSVMGYEKKSPKSYTKRSRDSSSFSPVKHLSNSSRHDSHEETKLCLKDSCTMERKTSSNESKRSYENRCKTPLHPKTNLVLQNSPKNVGSSQELSKNSEKNDKLMLDKDILVVNEKPPNTSSQFETISVINESSPLMECKKSKTDCIQFGHVLSETDSKSLKPESEIRNRGSTSPQSDLNENGIKASLCQESLPEQSNSLVRIEAVNSNEPKFVYVEDEKSMSSTSQIKLDGQETCKVSTGIECIDLTNQEDSQEPMMVDDDNNIRSGLMSENAIGISEHENLEENPDNVSKVVSFFYNGRLKKQLLDSDDSNKEKLAEDKKKGSNTKLSNLKTGFSFRPKSDISISSKNRLTEETQSKTLENMKSSQSIIQTECETNTGEPLINRSTYTETESDIVRRISSDFFEESSLDEEDFLGTDEELEMKDHLFSGFKEITDNDRFQSRRFRQFLNRFSESENEEWYVNAGNLTMEVRKERSLLSDKSLESNNDKCYDPSRSRPTCKTESFVGVVGGDKEVISCEKLNEKNGCSKKFELTNAPKAKLSELKEIIPCKSTVKINTDKSDMHEKASNKDTGKIEAGLNHKIDLKNSAAEGHVSILGNLKGCNKITSPSLLNDDSAKISQVSVSIKKSYGSSKNRNNPNDTTNIDKMETKLVFSKEEMSNVNRKEPVSQTLNCEVEKEKQINESNEDHKKLEVESKEPKEIQNSNFIVCHIRKHIALNVHDEVTSVISSSNHIEIANCSPKRGRPSKKLNGEEICEIENNDEKERGKKLKKTTSCEIYTDNTVKNTTAVGIPSPEKDNDLKSEKNELSVKDTNNEKVNSTSSYNLMNNQPLKAGLPSSEFVDDHDENISANDSSGCVTDQIVCSTPLKEKRIEEQKHSTQNVPTKQFSCSKVKKHLSTVENHSEHYFESNNTALSDDESLADLKKACSLPKGKTVICAKGNLLTDGFSPHKELQASLVQGNRCGETDTEKQEIKMHGCANIESGANDTSSENVDFNLNNGVEFCKIPKKRGRKQKLKGAQDEIQTQDSLSVAGTSSDNVGCDKFREVTVMHDIAAEHLVKIDNPDIPEKGDVKFSFFKKRGRPPKRKVNKIDSISDEDMSASKNLKGIDPISSLTESEDELLLSVHSEEIGGILKTGIFEVNKNPEPQRNTVPCKLPQNDQDGKNSKVIQDFSQNKMSGNISKSAVPKKRGRKSKLVKSSPVNKGGGSPPVQAPGESIDIKKDSSGDISMEKSCEIPKKRGRKPKLKSDNSANEKLDSDTSSPGVQVLGESLEIKVDSVRDTIIEKSCEIATPKKRGRKPKLKLDTSQQVSGSQAIEMDSLSKDKIPVDDPNDFSEEFTSERISSNVYDSEIKVPKKRGRKPKPKSDAIDSSAHDVGTDDSFVDTISENIPLLDRLKLSETQFNTSNSNTFQDEDFKTQPKKRGRKPKIKADASSSHLVDELAIEGENNVTPKKRGHNSNVNNNINNKEEYAENTLPARRRRGKSPRVMPVNNNTASGASSISGKDGDCDDSFSNELLGTDIIFINEEKLNSTISSKKRTNKSKINLGRDSIDMSEVCTLDKSSSEEDSDDANTLPTRAARRRKRIECDEYSDDSESSKKPVKKAVRKAAQANQQEKSMKDKPSDKVFFSAKHSFSDRVVCAVCKQEMAYGNYKNHHAIFKHYMLTWLDGEEKPVDMNDEKEVVNRLWFAKRAMGKTPFRCPNCNLPKLSAVGFQSHIKFCGKENSEKDALMVTCEVCGARLMPSSMKPHMYMKHNTNSPTTSSKTDYIDESVIIPRGRRAAANKAVEVIQQSQTDDPEQEEAQSRPNSPERKSHLVHLYIRPRRMVPPREYQQWKKSLSENSVVTCSQPGCSFTADSTIVFRKHFFTCPFGSPRTFKCRCCAFTSISEPLMQQHVEEKHDSVSGQGHFSDDESSDESEGEHKGVKNRYFGSNLPFKFLKAVTLPDKRRNQKKRIFFSNSLEWTLKLRENVFSSEVLFPEARPDAESWLPLLPEAAAPHLPELHISIRFRGSDSTWSSLRRFQGTIVDGIPLLFAGGPVWAMAWAPIPDLEVHQYLAVATHPSMDSTHEMASVYSYPSLIQLWCLGRLHNIDPDATKSSPKLVLGIAHGRGAVWSLAWCPAGAFMKERLGLLAAACSDGSVVVFSIPIHTQAAENPIYNVKPVFELKLGCEMMTQCTTVDWHSVAPHNIIAGGFANGMVALWDLTTKSPLLKDGTSVFPFKVIEAHLSSVTAVHLSWTQGDVSLMTASLDRATKFWRLDDTTMPVNTLRKASVTDAVMPSNWLMSINAYDDVYSINSSHVTGYNYRETFSMSNTNFVLQPGTIWSLSFNDWLNACACASEMGKVTVFFSQQLLAAEDTKKVKNNAYIGDLISCSARSVRDGTPATEGFGQRYNDCVSSVGLEINFQENVSEGRPAPASSSDNMDSYPILSVNKVSWNPNMSSFTWLAAGLQCGLVAIPGLKCVPKEDISELLKHKADR